MGFSTDYTDVQSFELIPKGEYEVIIKAITERTTPNGATGLNLTFVIRNDVEQKCQNRYLFHTLWKRKEQICRFRDTALSKSCSLQRRPNSQVERLMKRYQNFVQTL